MSVETSTSTRSDILSAAKQELDLQGETPGPYGPISQDPKQVFKDNGVIVRGGWARLRNMFVDAVPDFAAGDDPTFRGAYGELPLNKSWCGIFGAYVLRRAGVETLWNLQDGYMSGSGVRLVKIFERKDTNSILPVNRNSENLYIEVGDVVTIAGKSNHHCVVTGISGTRKSLDTIEGNTEFQEIRKGPGRSTQIVTTVYKVMAETRYPHGLFNSEKIVPQSDVDGLVGSDWQVTVDGSVWYYKFSRNFIVSYGRKLGERQGTGQWSTAGNAFVKAVWPSSGSMELWDISSGLRKFDQTGQLFLGGRPAISVRASVAQR